MIKQEYYKVSKVIQSCDTLDHLKVTDKLIDLFIKKWKNDPDINLYAAKLGSLFRLKYKSYGQGIQK